MQAERIRLADKAGCPYSPSPEYQREGIVMLNPLILILSVPFQHKEPDHVGGGSARLPGVGRCWRVDRWMPRVIVTAGP
ncbi:hypothetical protein ACLB1M_31995 [Escherichia coli]